MENLPTPSSHNNDSTLIKQILNHSLIMTNVLVLSSEGDEEEICAQLCVATPGKLVENRP